MSVDEGARFKLFESAQRQLGYEEAVTLMEMLPQVEWPEIATKSDLAVLGAELRAEIADRTSSAVRTMVLAMIANNAAVFGLAFAAARLAG